jgi:uncharacterized protein
LKLIKITAGGISLNAELDETPAGNAIWDALPIEAGARRWGDEIYFEIPVESKQEPQARSDMSVGEIAYWPTGKAFCIFFGPTPASRGKQPRAASPVNPLGNIQGDARKFRSVKDGEKIGLERA